MSSSALVGAERTPPATTTGAGRDRSRSRSAVAILGGVVLAAALVLAPPVPAGADAGPRAVQPTVLAVSPTAAMAALQGLVDASGAGAGAAGQVTGSSPGNGSADPPAAAPANLSLPSFSLPTPIEVVWALIRPLINPVTAPLVNAFVIGGFFFLLGTAAVANTLCPVCYRFVFNLVVGFFTGAPLFRFAATAEAGESPAADVEPADAEISAAEPKVSEPADETSTLATESGNLIENEAKASAATEEGSATENIADDDVVDELYSDTTDSDTVDEVTTEEDIGEPAATEADESLDNEVDEEVGSVPADDAATDTAPSDDDSSGNDTDSE